MPTDYYIGLMSGTSLDGVDVCLVDFSNDSINTLYAETFLFQKELKQALLNIIQQPQVSLSQIGTINHQLSLTYADAVKQCLTAVEAELPTVNAISAIGCHGQTVYHKPQAEFPFSLQLGSGAILAEETGIPVVTDYRNNDIALGGQGAPLVPAFHASLASPGTKMAFLNLGGVANVTLIDGSLSDNEKVLGYDTGPANCLLNDWFAKWHDSGSDYDYDVNGNWARSGTVNKQLLEIMLADDYFTRPAPKSTGREYFNLQWLTEKLHQLETMPANEDIQATLAELTAATVARALNDFAPDRGLVCGGGIHNHYLMTRLEELVNADLNSTNMIGIDPDAMEAIAFAWLARKRMLAEAASVSSVTGASKDAITGCVYLPSS